MLEYRDNKEELQKDVRNDYDIVYFGKKITFVEAVWNGYKLAVTYGASPSTWVKIQKDIQQDVDGAQKKMSDEGVEYTKEDLYVGVLRIKYETRPIPETPWETYKPHDLQFWIGARKLEGVAALQCHVSNRHIGLSPDGSVAAMSEAISDNEKIRFVPLPEGLRAIRRAKRPRIYIRAEAGGGSGHYAYFDASHVGTDERFSFENQGGGLVAIKSKSGSYLRAEEGGGDGKYVAADADAPGDHEKYNIHIL